MFESWTKILLRPTILQFWTQKYIWHSLWVIICGFSPHTGRHFEISKVGSQYKNIEILQVLLFFFLLYFFLHNININHIYASFHNYLYPNFLPSRMIIFYTKMYLTTSQLNVQNLNEVIASGSGLTKTIYT